MEVERKHLITEQDIRNIEKSAKICQQRHTNDVISMELLMEEYTDSIIFYKKQHWIYQRLKYAT